MSPGCTCTFNPTAAVTPATAAAAGALLTLQHPGQCLLLFLLVQL
jgi:hypothetical protein